ncbi:MULTISPECIES: SRPBCC domain-containing protein [unclassified Blastococcus]
MQLENSFTVPVPIDEAWRVLLDIERIAPCMPGAALDSVTGDDFTGRVKVKLGPINLTYQGKASFVEKDEAAHRAVIDARGKDQRGNGTAAAVVTATLAAEGSVTRVDVLTDLNITGRPAQFGRGVMTDVGNKLLGQFADKLAAQLGEGDAGAATAPAGAAGGAGAAATVSGVAEEVAASVEQTPGDNAAAEAVRKAGTAAKKTAAKKTAAASAAPSATDTAPITLDAAPAATDLAPAATDTAPAASPAAAGTPVEADTPPPDATLADRVPGASDVPARPSTPPSGPTAPPTRPATGGPAKSSPATLRPPVAEPEPIDLLEVAGGAALTRYAKPLAGVAAVLFLLSLVVRRRRNRL